MQLKRPRVVVSVPGESTQVERSAIQQTTLAAGAGSVTMLEAPIAAAIGAGLPVSDAAGSMIVDIGAGTMDVLYHDTASAQHYKAVVKSPVQTVAAKAESLRGNLFVTGVEMGGGPITEVLKERACRAEVIMTASAAATLSHTPDRIEEWGIRIIGNDEGDKFRENLDYAHLTIEDLDLIRLEKIVKGFGVDFEFDVVGVCAQDHGVPPPGGSHLVFRHNINRKVLEQHPFPHALLYRSSEVPEPLNRLRAIAKCAEDLPTGEVFVMDSGMAAILGASMDSLADARNNIMVLDIATSHTVGAALSGGELAGFFEYHTRDITLNRLEALLRDLAEGQLTNDDILREGGHGAYVRRAIGFDTVEITLATGPKRRLIKTSRLPMTLGAPWGDNMMTGTVGLLEAIRRRKGLARIEYF